jgi:hypothetical protein
MDQNNNFNRQYYNLLAKLTALPMATLLVVILIIEISGNSGKNISYFQYLNELMRVKRSDNTTDVSDIFFVMLHKFKDITKDHMAYMTEIIVGNKVVFNRDTSLNQDPEELLLNLINEWDFSNYGYSIDLYFERDFTAKNGVTYKVKTDLAILFKDVGNIKNFHLGQHFFVIDSGILFEMSNWDEYFSKEFPLTQVSTYFISGSEDEISRYATEEEKLKYKPILQEVIDTSALPFIGWETDNQR